jgi:hypothetical protein
VFDIVFFFPVKIISRFFPGSSREDIFSEKKILLVICDVDDKKILRVCDVDGGGTLLGLVQQLSEFPCLDF